MNEQMKQMKDSEDIMQSESIIEYIMVQRGWLIISDFFCVLGFFI